ncbi:MAG TPA: C39 family peptidase [Candidatus Acidoferrum sp.]|nr:C39 family peptidase [Candidatus Acidoferrum sp.]
MYRRRIPGLVLFFVAGACIAVAAETPALWIDVPFVAQSKNGCGSAAIAMVMDYWNQKAGQAALGAARAAEIQQALYSPREEGIPARAMQGYFEDSGYQVFVFAGDWTALERHLSRGRPLIVALKASGPHGPLHYLVVVGIDAAQGTVFVNDPAQQKMLRLSREGFESEWSATRNWTLLAVPRPPG